MIGSIEDVQQSLTARNEKLILIAMNPMLPAKGDLRSNAAASDCQHDDVRCKHESYMADLAWLPLLHPCHFFTWYISCGNGCLCVCQLSQECAKAVGRSCAPSTTRMRYRTQNAYGSEESYVGTVLYRLLVGCAFEAYDFVIDGKDDPAESRCTADERSMRWYNGRMLRVYWMR